MAGLPGRGIELSSTTRADGRAPTCARCPGCRTVLEALPKPFAAAGELTRIKLDRLFPNDHSGSFDDLGQLITYAGICLGRWQGRGVASTNLIHRTSPGRTILADRGGQSSPKRVAMKTRAIAVS